MNLHPDDLAGATTAASFAGDQVVLASLTAARLAPGLRLLARLAHRDGLVLDADLLQVLAACEAAERAHLRRPPTVAATLLDRAGCASPSSDQVLDAGEVARRARVSGQAVRKAAATGRLPGRVGPDGRWWFEQQAVAEWLAARRRSA